MKVSGKYPLFRWVCLPWLLWIAPSGCEPLTTYSYQVTNATSRTVTVGVKIYPFLDPDNREQRSVVTPPQATETIYVGTQNGPPSDSQGRDSFHRFERIDLIRDDSTRAKTNLKKRNRWLYRQTGKHSYTYRLEVVDSDF